MRWGQMGLAGTPRLPPDQIRGMVAKMDNDVVARSSIVFAKGKDVFNLGLAPYFQPTPPPSAPASMENQAEIYQQYVGKRAWDIGIGCFWVSGLPGMFLLSTLGIFSGNSGFNILKLLIFMVLCGLAGLVGRVMIEK